MFTAVCLDHGPYEVHVGPADLTPYLDLTPLYRKTSNSRTSARSTHPNAAERRHRHDVAVLRALGMTRWQSRGVVVTQASVLAAIGLLFGIPLRLAPGRTVWRVVAENTRLLYVPPVAVAALVLIGPLALLTASLLAAPLGQRATRQRIGHVRSERGRRGCQLHRRGGVSPVRSSSQHAWKSHPAAVQLPDLSIGARHPEDMP